MPTASCSGDSEDRSDELATQRLSGELSQCVSIDFEVSKDEGTGCTSASVWAIATWKRSYSDPEYQEQLKCDTWEVVLPELIFEPSDRQ